MGELMERTLDTLKPEAAYFFPYAGKRAFILVVDVPDEASLAPTVEPFWQDLNAQVDIWPVMNAEDLRTGLSRIG